MKCEDHPENDVVGTCASCGRSVCNECKETHDGILHCRVCITKGRIVDRPSLDWQSIFYHLPQPKPTEDINAPLAMSNLVHPYPMEQPDPKPFKIGKFGAIGLGLFMLLLAFTIPTGHIWIILTFGGGAGLVLLTFPFIIGLYGYYKNYGMRWGMYASWALVLMAVLMLIMGLITYVSYGPFNEGFFEDADPVELFLGNGLLGFGFVMVVVALYKLTGYFLPTTGIRNMIYSVMSGLALGSTFLIFYLMLTFVPLLPEGGFEDLVLTGMLLIGWLAISISTIIMYFVFLRSPLPDRMLDQISDDEIVQEVEATKAP